MSESQKKSTNPLAKDSSDLAIEKIDRVNGGLDDLYREIVMEHHKYPRNFGVLKTPDGHFEGYNPLCGDRVTVDVVLNSERNTIQEIRFQGQGCSICMASASMMTEEVEKAKLSEALGSIQNFRDMLQDLKPADIFQSDVASLAGVKKFPVRIKCALLPWTTLKEVIEQCSKNL